MTLTAQETTYPTRAVYAELGGAGLVYSFSDQSLLTVPVQVNRLFGRGNHYFEVGAGTTLVNFRETVYDYDSNGNAVERESKTWHFIMDMGETPAVMGTLNFGYRRVPDEPGFTWRVNLTPVFNSNGFWPLFAGIGAGYAF
ncbi:hypothetical protein GCM10011339_27590 [Echinicola rosea]|uniref:Outer membrane protein beta-barrel domain-containing protein n=2 Tax=Echinicola rosea TaxID=1807691 RepID=A0ABQ1V6D6_9BACT|nr:hypothetical protein GCM10011339_27590 [Echinicola rosea]